MSTFNKVQRVLLWLVLLLSIALLLNAIVEKYDLIVIGIFSVLTFGSGFMLLTFKQDQDYE